MVLWQLVGIESCLQRCVVKKTEENAEHLHILCLEVKMRQCHGSDVPLALRPRLDNTYSHPMQFSSLPSGVAMSIGSETAI
jgi:hypothetical protein